MSVYSVFTDCTCQFWLNTFAYIPYNIQHKVTFEWILGENVAKISSIIIRLIILYSYGSVYEQFELCSFRYYGDSAW